MENYAVMYRYFDTVTEYKGLDINLPKRQTIMSAGYDIESAETVIVGAGETVLVPTGLKAYMPSDEFLAIYPRSSLATKFGVVLANTVGIIDSDYADNKDNEGHIMVPLKNTSDVDFVVKKGDRIAQAIFQSYCITNNDETTKMRSGGFGSTGV